MGFEEDIKKALTILREGGIILYPTDTIWGIGCDARNSEAVKRIFRLKQRADSKSMLVLVDNDFTLQRYVGEVPEAAWQLIDAAVDPLTIIYDGAQGLAPELIAEDGTIGIRITGESFSKELCKKLGAPLVSTSANLSGSKAPTNFNEISEEIKNGVDYIVSYGRDDANHSVPSHIIKVGNGGLIKIIR